MEEVPIAKYIKNPSKIINYRLEKCLKTPGMKTRPQTQISAFSQTYSNTAITIDLKYDHSTILEQPPSRNKQRKFKIKEKLIKAIKPEFKTDPKAFFGDNSSKIFTSREGGVKSSFTNLKLKIRPVTQGTTDDKEIPIKIRSSIKINNFRENRENEPRKSCLKIHSLDADDMRTESFSERLVNSLFRKNDINHVKMTLTSIEKRKSSIIAAPNTMVSSSNNKLTTKTPMLPEHPSKTKEFEMYMNTKNYKLSNKIINSLKKTLETTIEERQILDKSFSEQKILEVFNTLLTHLSNIPSIIENCVRKREHREDFFDAIALITHELSQTKDFSLLVDGMKLQAKLYKIYGDFNLSLQIYTNALHLCSKHDLHKLKVKIYKRLGKLFLELQDLKKAKSNFIKSLQYAWFVSSRKYELTIYDQLGIIAFYEGDIEKAKYYHSRMINSLTEDENSSVRLVAISKVKTKIEMRKNMEANFMFSESAYVSSDEEEVGLYEIKKKNSDGFEFKDLKRDTFKKKNRVSYNEKQKLLIKQVGSSMFKSKNDSKERSFNENVLKRIRKKIQQERDMENLLDSSKKTNIYDIFKKLPEDVANSFITKEHGIDDPETFSEEKKFPSDLMKGLYGVEKSILLKNFQRIENYKFLKATSVNKRSFFLSHLSSNRNLDRFTRVFNPNNYKKNEVKQEFRLHLDKATSMKIKKSLLKFKSNILVAVSRLEFIKRGNVLSPTTSLYLRRGGLSLN